MKETTNIKKDGWRIQHPLGASKARKEVAVDKFEQIEGGTCTKES